MKLLIALVIAACMIASVNADCASYCTSLLSTCSSYQSFASQTECTRVCATYPTGATGDVNSLECRESYVTAAASGDAANNCYYASVHGGGRCGTTCDGYCNLMTSSQGFCKTDMNVYASFAECSASFCAHFPNNTFPIGSAPSAIASGNSRECRLYHASVGVATLNHGHCDHATPLSVIGTCVTSDTTYSGDGNSQTATYCDNHIRICGTTTTNPTYGQYSSASQCKAVAAKFPRAVLNSQSGNSIDARNYHVNVASTNADSMFHCQHSGLNGKNFCTDSALAYDRSLGCDSFCEQNIRICNGSVNTQFASIAACVRFCNALPAASESPYPTSGDSLQCRFYHLGVAATSDANAATHCPHTGITGGDGACGTTAEAFCDVQLMTCNATGSVPYNTLAQYSSRAQCIAAAAAFPRDTTGTPSSPVASGNTLDCRQYHASVAQQSGQSAIDHCYHTGALGGAGVCGTACQGFCSTVMAACNATVGGLQFSSNAECLTYCASFPVGTLTMPAATVSGNTLACRAYHAGVALAGDSATKVIHCPHAAAVSGSNTCGTACEAYCNTVQAACNGTDAQFATTAACLSACASYATSGTTGDATGATLQCRQYHAGVALTGNAAAKATHCPHAGTTPTEYCVASSASSAAVSSLALAATAVVAAIVFTQ